MAKLDNERREMFCQYYITEIDGKLYNGTKAAMKAGYSEKTAYSQANRLLKNDEVKSRIAELKQEVMDELGIDKLYVLSKYKKIVDDDISNYLSYRSVQVKFENDEGEEDFYHKLDINLKNSTTIDTWNVAEVSIGRDGQFKFKLHCKDKALTKLGEYIGLFEGEEDSDKEVMNKLDKIMSGLNDQASN